LGRGARPARLLRSSGPSREAKSGDVGTPGRRRVEMSRLPGGEEWWCRDSRPLASPSLRRPLLPGPSSKDTPPKAAAYPIELGPSRSCRLVDTEEASSTGSPLAGNDPAPPCRIHGGPHRGRRRESDGPPPGQGGPSPLDPGPELPWEGYLWQITGSHVTVSWACHVPQGTALPRPATMR
jgi:hypothetical protein